MRLFPILCVVLLAACLVPSTGQNAYEPSLDPITPFDEYGNLCWENEQARLDNFAIQLQKDPTLVGYIVVYAGRISCRDEAKYRGGRARNYVLKREVESGRVIFKDGGFRPDLQTILHLQKKDAGDYSTSPTLKKNEASIKRCVDKVFERVLCLNSQ